MIDFACKQFKLEDIIKCGLGLSKADFGILKFMLNNPAKNFTSEDIATKVNLNLSTVQRAVKKLNAKEILFRSQENLEGGGYVFVYQIKNKAYIKKIIINIIHNWVKKVETEMDKW